MRRNATLVCAGALILASGCAVDVLVGSNEGAGEGSSLVGITTTTGDGGRGGTTTSTTTTVTGTTSTSTGTGTGTSTTTGTSTDTGTSTGTGTTTDTSNWICDPSPLVGMHWTGTEQQVVQVDPFSGALTVLDVLPGTPGVPSGFSGYDPSMKRVYQFLDYGGAGEVVTIDAVTGSVLAMVPYPTNQIYNPEVNNAGEIVVLRTTGGVFTEQAALDPMTGALTTLSAIPVLGGYGQGLSAFDRTADRLYRVGDDFTAIFDGTTGALLGSITLSYGGVGIKNLYNPVVTRAGALIGVVSIAPPMTYTSRVDPATGAVTPLAPFNAPTAQGIRTYDPCTDRIYQFHQSTMDVVDGTTGQHLSTVALPGEVINVEAVY